MLVCKRAHAVADAVLAVGQLRLAAGDLLGHLLAPNCRVEAAGRGGAGHGDSRGCDRDARKDLETEGRAGAAEHRPHRHVGTRRSARRQRCRRQWVQRAVQLEFELAVEIAHL